MRNNVWRRLSFKQDGTVTIFAVVVLSSLLLFFGTLIDYARIAAMQLMTEDAARTGVRSVLSAYDSWLYERYGLFGRGGTEGEAIFKETLEGSRGEAASGSGFGIVRTEVADAKLLTSKVLGDHGVFGRQVLEEMKYKAPVDLTLEVISKLAPLAGALKQSGQTLDTFGELRRLYEKREALLEGVLLLQEQAAKLVLDSEALRLVPVGNGDGAPGTMKSLLEGHSAYMEQVRLAEEAKGREIREQIRSYEAEASSLSQRLRSLNFIFERRHAELLLDAKRKLEQAESVNEEMRTVASRGEASNGYDSVARKEVTGSEAYPVSPDIGSELDEARRSAERLIRDSAWWTSYRNELNEQETSGADIASEIEQLLSRFAIMMDPLLSQSSLPRAEAGVTEIQASVRHYETMYIGPASQLAERGAELENADIKRQLNEQETKTAAAWQNAGRLLNGLAGMRDLPEHRELFQAVKERYENNLAFNRKSEEHADAGDNWRQAKDANEAVDRSSNQMEGIFAGMADMLTNSRDMLYYGEYVSGKFRHFAPQQLLDLMERGDLEGIAASASFHNQEMEYWLYGLHDPAGNLIAAYGELFGARLAIRTMEGLIVSRSLGHPLLILSAAILYGVEKTAEDMLDFARKGKAQLSRYAKVELSYLDYLRLFALLHGGKAEVRLSRMIAVIEQNSDLDLSLVPAGVTGEATVSMKLWFLPAATKLIGKFGLLDGRVRNGRYETTKTAGWSY